jgi:hypothetical protein
MAQREQPDEKKGYGRRYGRKEITKHPDEGSSLLRKDAPEFFTFVITHLQRICSLWNDCKRVATPCAESETLMPWKMPRTGLVTGIVETLVELMLRDWRVGIDGPR